MESLTDTKRPGPALGKYLDRQCEDAALPQPR
jgi:hypothetical protein